MFRGSSKKQHGQTLVDLAMWVAIALVIIAGGAVLYFRISNNTNVSSALSSLQATIADTQKLYSTDPNGFSNISVDDLVKNHIVPSNEIVSGAWVSPNGGTVSVASDDLFGTAGDSATFTLPAVKTAQCSGLVQGLASQYPRVSVGGTDVVNTGTGLAFSAAALGTACASSANGVVSVAVTFGR